jgi:hypothetical protein
VVKRDARQYATVLMLALSAVLGLLLPPEHVHRAEADHHGTIHRHYQAHQSHQRQASIDHDEDTDPLWLASVGAVGRRIELPRADWTVLPQSIAIVAVQRPEVGALSVVPIPIHDPPHVQSAGLRAPPESRL